MGLKWSSPGPSWHLMSPQQPPKGLRWLVWARHGSGWAGVSSILVYVGLRGPTKRLYRVSVAVKALSRLSRSYFGGSFRRPYRGEEGPLGPLDTGKRLGAWSPFHRSHQLGHRLTHPDHPPWAPSTSAQPTGQIFSGACGLPAAGNGVKRAQIRKRMSVTFRGAKTTY